jgi:hypothetical protein
LPRITAGNTRDDARILKAEERKNAYANYKYRLMEPCDHEGTMENDRCGACGYTLYNPVKLKISDTGRGSDSVSKTEAYEGDEVVVSVTPKGAYTPKVLVKETQDNSILMAVMSAKGSSGLKFSWNRINNADG